MVFSVVFVVVSVFLSGFAYEFLMVFYWCLSGVCRVLMAFFNWFCFSGESLFWPLLKSFLGFFRGFLANPG